MMKRLPYCCVGGLAVAVIVLIGATTLSPPASDDPTSDHEPEATIDIQTEEKTLQIQYLEIVTPDVDETCEALAKMHNVVFSEPVMEFGNARTADLEGGGRLGIRAPMRESELPVIRPYVLVKDIEGAVKSADEAGATIAMPPMAIPGQGRFAIYILGGIEHGLWELPE